MTQNEFTGTAPVPPHLQVDAVKLESYLVDSLEEFAGPLTIEKFKGGQSNPTYLLTTPGRRYVLRRKPPGQLLASAHAVDREFEIISKLGLTGFPVPAAYHYCSDPEIAGTPFFVMEFLDGRIFWDATLPDVPTHDRSRYYHSLVETLAVLHGVDVARAGLQAFGKYGDYFARQIKRWSRQYRDAETRSLPAMDRLIEWLPQNVPVGDETVIVHGDFRLDNVVFHPVKPTVIGVLDWELSTLGHPLADLTYFLMTWKFPPSVRGGLAGLDLGALGLPDMTDLATAYSRKREVDLDLSDLDFCLAFNMFRLAAIAQGVSHRSLQGNASSETASQFEAQIPALADLAWTYGRKKRCLTGPTLIGKRFVAFSDALSRLTGDGAEHAIDKQA